MTTRKRGIKLCIVLCQRNAFYTWSSATFYRKSDFIFGRCCLLLLFVLSNMVNDKSKRYKQQNTWIKETCTRICGANPKDFVQEFKDGCMVFGISQTEAFR